MSVSAIIIIVLALVFIIGGPIIGSFANKVSHNADKTELKKSGK